MSKDHTFIKRLSVFGLVLILGVVFLSGCAKQAVTTKAQEVWGRAEAKELDVNSKIAGRVLELLVKEGDTVKMGQVIARIDNRDLIAKANQAQAGIDALQAQLSQAGTLTSLQDRTVQESLNSAQAQLEKAEFDMNQSEKDYSRFKELFAQGAVAQQVLDNYQLKYQVAKSTYAQAKSAVAAAEASLLQSQINRDNEVSAKNKVAQAEASLREVQVYIDETQIVAPIDGIVTTKYVEAGEMVSTGTPIVAIQDPLDNWVNIKVKETELGQYKLQDTVQLIGRDDKLKLQGKIIDISKKPEFATYRATNERGDNDIITFNVKIQVNSDQVRPGMRFKILNGGK